MENPVSAGYDRSKIWKDGRQFRTEDIALGIINMCSSPSDHGVLAARLHRTDDIVCTGSVTQVRQGHHVLAGMAGLYHLRFHVPDGAEFATALGAALQSV